MTIKLIILTAGYLNGQSYELELKNTAINNNLVGMSVVVVCGDDILNSFHYGKANINQNIAVSDVTMFRIASISKAVTSTALMTLYENGMLNLDDNINDYLNFEVYNPNYPNDSITFRMLLSHTSSLQDGNGYSDFLNVTYNQNPVPPIRQLLMEDSAYYSTDIWSNHTPGSYFSYSNLNFGVIATLIEQISGIRFDRFVRDSILIPLKIKGSFNVNHIDSLSHIAVLYRNGVPQADNYNGTYPPVIDSTQYSIGDNGLLFSPQGGLRISALDLSKFLRMNTNYGTFDGTLILDSNTIEMMHQKQWEYNGSNGNNYYNLFNKWGLGYHLTTNTPNGDIVLDTIEMNGHPGEAYGLISDMYFDLKSGFGLIFITNGYYGNQYYAWGNNSAFYLPEEEVFNHIEQYLLSSCIESNIYVKDSDIYDLKPFAHFYSSSRTLFILEDGLYTLYDSKGQQIMKFESSTSNINLNHLNKGLYLLIRNSDGTSMPMKIIIY